MRTSTRDYIPTCRFDFETTIFKVLPASYKIQKNWKNILFSDYMFPHGLISAHFTNTFTCLI